MPGRHHAPETAALKDVVALTLAIGIGVAINLLVAGVVWDSVKQPVQVGLSENATQVLTTAFGGMIGVLGSYVGYRAGATQQDRLNTEADQAEQAEPERPEPYTGP